MSSQVPINRWTVSQHKKKANEPTLAPPLLHNLFNCPFSNKTYPTYIVVLVL